MSRWRSVLAAVALVALLGAFAIWLGNRSEPEPWEVGNTGEVVNPGGVAPERIEVAVVRAERERREAAALREDPHGEPGPTAGDLARYERLRGEAEPVARRFFGAFARYELGDASDRIARELAATASGPLTRQLRSTPPHVRMGSGPSEPARLGRLELVPGAVRHRRIVRVELVGVVRRSGRREPIAIELHRAGDSWRVDGLGQ